MGGIGGELGKGGTDGGGREGGGRKGGGCDGGGFVGGAGGEAGGGSGEGGDLGALPGANGGRHGVGGYGGRGGGEKSSTLCIAGRPFWGLRQSWGCCRGTVCGALVMALSYHWSNAGCGHASSCLPSTGIGAVRCCGAPSRQDRRRCLSVCDPRTLPGPTASPWSHTEMTPRTTLLDGVHATHAGAAAECAARGLRLCSRAELQQCCKMGCGLDKHPTHVETKAA